MLIMIIIVIIAIIMVIIDIENDYTDKKGPKMVSMIMKMVIIG